MSDGPVLTTPRLILRPPVAADFGPWAAFHREGETKRYLGGKLGARQAWRDLSATVDAWGHGGVAMFSVIDRTTGQWIGRIGPHRPAGWPGVEIGWAVTRAARGRGLAYEAAVAAIDFAVDTLGWSDVAHLIDPANTASVRLAERLGARPRGQAQVPPPNEAVAVHSWGQSATDWRDAQAARTAKTA